MERKKIVKEILGTELTKLGFVYEKGSYVRRKNGIKQSIEVGEERYARKRAKMYFYANAYGQKPVELEDFVPGILQESWEYETDEEYRAIIQQFKEWTLTYGLEQLEKMSIPTTEERPKPETNRYLYEHHEELNREYLKKMGMEGVEAPDVLFALQDEMEKLQRLPFKEVEQILVGLAAVYGHCMCLLGKGTWYWNEERQSCLIDNVGESGILEYPLLSLISSYQRKIIREDEYIKRYINNIYSRNTQIKLGCIKGEPTDLKVISEIYDKMYQRREEKGRI